MSTTNKIVCSVYTEIIARGDSKEQIQEAIENKLQDTFGVENVIVYDAQELTEDEVIELDTGVHKEELSQLDKEFARNIDSVVD